MSHAFEEIIQDFTNSITRNSEDRWYGLYGLNLVFKEDEAVGTAGVCIREGRAHFYYNPKFIAGMSKEKLRYLYLHEIMHLIGGHNSRMKAYGMKHEVANVAADAIINSSLEKPGAVGDKIERPSENLILLDPAYGDKDLFLEPYYEYICKKQEQEDKDSDGDGDDSQTPGKSGKSKAKSGKQSKGKVLDNHGLEDDCDAETANSISDSIIEGLKAKGDLPGSAQALIDNLRKQPENFLKLVRKVVAQVVGYSTPEQTYRRENRKGLDGIRGKVKIGTQLVCIVDTSGSIFNDLPELLGLLLRDGYLLRVIQCDTKVQDDMLIERKSQLSKITAKGGGGTLIMPAIEYAKEKYPKLPLLVCTDGFTDTLHFHGRGNILVTIGVEPKVSGDVKIVHKAMNK